MPVHSGDALVVLQNFLELLQHVDTIDIVPLFFPHFSNRLSFHLSSTGWVLAPAFASWRKSWAEEVFITP